MTKGLRHLKSPCFLSPFEYIRSSWAEMIHHKVQVWKQTVIQPPPPQLKSHAQKTKPSSDALQTATSTVQNMWNLLESASPPKPPLHHELHNLVLIWGPGPSPGSSHAPSGSPAEFAHAKRRDGSRKKVQNKDEACKCTQFLHGNWENVYALEKGAPAHWPGSCFCGNWLGTSPSVLGIVNSKCVDVMYSAGMRAHMVAITQAHTCRDAAGISCVRNLDVWPSAFVKGRAESLQRLFFLWNLTAWVAIRWVIFSPSLLQTDLFTMHPLHDKGLGKLEAVQEFVLFSASSATRPHRLSHSQTSDPGSALSEQSSAGGCSILQVPMTRQHQKNGRGKNIKKLKRKRMESWLEQESQARNRQWGNLNNRKE